MKRLDPEVLAERAAILQRHLQRVEELLPDDPHDFQPMTGAADGVILHLWQAVQMSIDVALSACVKLGLGTPSTYADSFRRLAEAQILPLDLSERLTKAAGFRNLIVHAYGQLDMRRVHEAARLGPRDLRSFFAELARQAL